VRRAQRLVGGENASRQGEGGRERFAGDSSFFPFNNFPLFHG